MFFLPRLSTPQVGYICHGDSTTRGANASKGSLRWVSLLSASFTPHRRIINSGIGGTPPWEIVDRLESTPLAMRELPHIIWLGRMEVVTDAADVYLEQVDRAWRLIPHSRKLFFTPGTGDFGSDKLGVSAHADEIVAAKNEMLLRYPNNILDMNQIFIDANDGSSGDLQDVAWGIVPRSLRADNIHNNDAGHALIAQSVFDWVLPRWD